PASGIPQKGISVATDKQRLSGLSLDDSEIKANPHADCGQVKSVAESGRPVLRVHNYTAKWTGVTHVAGFSDTFSVCCLHLFVPFFVSLFSWLFSLHLLLISYKCILW